MNEADCAMVNLILAERDRLRAEVERSHRYIGELKEGGRLLGQDIDGLNHQIEELRKAARELEQAFLQREAIEGSHPEFCDCAVCEARGALRILVERKS